MKTVLYVIVLVLFSMTLPAQVGIGTTTPEAALDITSATDGLLIPRIVLTSETSPLPLTAPAEGELIYNTAVIGTLTPGFYYWSAGTGSWIRIGDIATPPPPPPSFGGWLLAGNAAVAADFIGTTNNVDLVFRRGGLLSGRIGLTNAFFGREAGNANTGGNNTYLGSGAGRLVSTAGSVNNVAIGFNAMQSALGRLSSQNTVIGAFAFENANGNNNTVIGNLAGATNQGSNNVIIGNQASNSTGNNSVAIGSGANTSSFQNSVALGSGAFNTASSQVRLGNNAVTSVVTSGTVTAFSFISNTTTYPDYVFEDYFIGSSKINTNYKFNTLEDSEAFVIKHGHLPGVKSYAEVMENDFKLDITEATITNLEKLEEQFLYITELNKKINSQQNTIENQEEKIKALEARLVRIEMLLKN